MVTTLGQAVTARKANHKVVSNHWWDQGLISKHIVDEQPGRTQLCPVQIFMTLDVTNVVSPCFIQTYSLNLIDSPVLCKPVFVFQNNKFMEAEICVSILTWIVAFRLLSRKTWTNVNMLSMWSIGIDCDILMEITFFIPQYTLQNVRKSSAISRRPQYVKNSSPT